LVEDPKWELAILATVQGFYEKLLQDYLDGEAPVPAGLEDISLQSDGDVHGTLLRMHCWLRLLDLAITPAMLRRSLTPETDAEIAEAMLRYFTRRKDTGDANRDKTDLVATFLYRHPRVPGQWERRGYGLDGSVPLAPFEIAMLEILADADAPALSEEQMQLLRQFDRLQDEGEKFGDLNTLLDSGVIVRVRELKQRFEAAFYHPSVLATIAPYNTTFGRRFDELFLKAAKEIKTFARDLEEQGGSILGNVDGMDVTVEHVSALQESELLRIDYGTALEKFRRVSRLRKALQERPPVRRVPPLPARTSSAGAKAANPLCVPDLEAMRAAVTPQQMSTEEGKLAKVEESVRAFVRVADARFRHVVPMRYFNLILTPAEVAAFCADDREEKSLPGQVKRALLRMVTVAARMTTELEELRRTQNSPSLWRLHADALVVLLEIERSVQANVKRVMGSGSTEDGAQIETVQASLKKLQDCTALVQQTLAPADKVARAVGGRSF
jgi:hypothetical protein